MADEKINTAIEQASLERSLKELQNTLAQERAWHEEEIDKKDREIETLEESLAAAQAEIRRLRSIIGVK